MEIRQISVERFSVTSSKRFQEVVACIEARIGRPDIRKFVRDVTASQTETELETVVHEAVGSSDLMEFIRFDIGEVLRKELGESAPRSLRLVAGNPLIMKQMLKFVPDVGSYAPVTILIDERSDGVHLSYDRMASLLAPYGSPKASEVARALDSKVEALLRAASASDAP
jgi:uncharacterized protein (DUF302 family)